MLVRGSTVPNRQDHEADVSLAIKANLWFQNLLAQYWNLLSEYTPSTKNFDALVLGYYDGDALIYAARSRNGFTPASCAELFKKMKPIEIDECPFANLPERKAGRWGAGLTASKMVECRWLKLVGQFEFVAWTSDNHLRHTSFVGLREDKSAKDVRRE